MNLLFTASHQTASHENDSHAGAARTLGRTEVLHLAARPVRLSVEQGCLWVTQDGEPEDLQLETGSGRDFDGHARLLVSALGGPARLRVLPLEAAAPGPVRAASARPRSPWHWLPRAAAALRGGAPA